ncbi:MAG TPA: NAD-binding protein [Candidatus Limnocylindrales bacterium]|nr:NAD-binding protein [Candidatus Limnocylindrales bacterium]
MRVLVIGAGRTGSRVLRQLRKNPAITVITADPRPRLVAVEEGLIADVDIREVLTPLTLDHILETTRPDLVLLAISPGDMGLGQPAGVGILTEALHEEIAALAPVPVIDVARAPR